ncbi:MAG: polyphosphate kinase 1 [Bdellovibrionota bacterium]
MKRQQFSELRPKLEVIETVSQEGHFMNRELSWLEFNSRVLSQSADPFLPLLERVRFLGIFTSNLDEFFMNRVGGLQRHVDAGIERPSADGLTPRQQLSAIYQTVKPLVAEQDRLFAREILPALRNEGIYLVQWSDLTDAEREFATAHFHSSVFPLLSPLAVDIGHPFPFISNLSTSLGFVLTSAESEEPQFCRLKLDDSLAKWIHLPAQRESLGHRFLDLHSLIVEQSETLFPGFSLRSWMPFRITRNIDLDIDDEDAEDLMEVIERELRERRSGQVVRFEHAIGGDPWLTNFLTEELELKEGQTFPRTGLLDYTALAPLLDLDAPRLKFPQWIPAQPAAFTEDKCIFHVIKRKDVLVHHPFESFGASVERFLKEAATDPLVRAIKMTIYRVGHVTPLIPYLVQAAHIGKQVVCLVELKARFDEHHNIRWAQELESAGVHVIYGVPGLKTHAKAILVIRQDSDKLRTYAHCGTGNYHTRTSSVYTDLGLFTAKEELTQELADFFNYLSGRSLKKDYHKLVVAPIAMESRFLALIQREIENQEQGLPSGIVAKMNTLEDPHIIEKLYEASRAGVTIRLVVRGACCLRPGVTGMSETIKVVSIVGRLLEHSRLFYFRNGTLDPQDGEYFIGSADWMVRNLHRRVELAIPVEDRILRARLWELIQLLLADVRCSWEMQADGHYTRRTAVGEPSPRNCHELLQEHAADTRRQQLHQKA